MPVDPARLLVCELAEGAFAGVSGDTTTFFSDLKIFPEQGVGVFMSRSGIGEITALNQIPYPATAIVRFEPAGIACTPAISAS